MSVAKARSRVAVEVKKHKREGSSSPSKSVEDAPQALAEAKLAAYIQRVVDEAPLLSADARQRLAALLGSRGARQ